MHLQEIYKGLQGPLPAAIIPRDSGPEADNQHGVKVVKYSIVAKGLK